MTDVPRNPTHAHARQLGGRHVLACDAVLVLVLSPLPEVAVPDVWRVDDGDTLESIGQSEDSSSRWSIRPPHWRSSRRSSADKPRPLL